MLGYVEPLRQTLTGTRSILYFGAQAGAGLTRGTLTAALSLLFWLVLGTAIVKWYDRKHLYRLHPDILAHVTKSVQDCSGPSRPPRLPPPPTPRSHRPASQARTALKRRAKRAKILIFPNSSGVALARQKGHRLPV